MTEHRMSGGATQHRVPCPHLEESEHLSAELCMASQISQANMQFFVSEGRVAAGVSESDLSECWERASEIGSTLVCCNACDRILLVGDGDPTIVHDGEPSEADEAGLSAEPEILSER
jgi:hypothetical protein